MTRLDEIIHGDCLEGLKSLPDGCVDLCVTDPPYVIGNQGGGFWSKAAEGNHYNARGTRKGMERLGAIKDGFPEDVLDELCRVMKWVNIYIFCSQKQLMPLLDYFVTRRGCNWNLLTWHKTNPIPACGNKYLSDTEYILFFRERGVRIAGSYATKRTFYTSLRNQEDNVRYHHPTVKPLPLVRNLIVNSCPVDGVVLDPYMGSGTTAVAAVMEGRRYIGYEIDGEYCRVAMERIEAAVIQQQIEQEQHKNGNEIKT